MNSERRDQAVENALVHRRPGTWRGVLLCLTLAAIGVILIVASHDTRGIGIGLAVLGILCAASGVLHLGWRRLRGGE
jgi:drug/metabolite transporter (DMT)-like permease